MFGLARYSRRARLTVLAILIAVTLIVRFTVASDHANQVRRDNQALSQANQEVQNQIHSGNLADPAVSPANQPDSAAAIAACVSAAGTNATKLAACAAQPTP